MFTLVTSLVQVQMRGCLSPCLEKKDIQKKLNSRAKDEMTLKKDSKLKLCLCTYFTAGDLTRNAIKKFSRNLLVY